MIELHPSEFASITHFLEGVKQKVLPHAICQGCSPGRIFVDRPENPQLILVWSALGYYFVAGNPNLSHDWVEASRVLLEIFVPASQASGESSFILVPAQDGWKEHLPLLLPGREVVEIYRRPFHFDIAQFERLERCQEHMPAQFQRRVLDATLTERIGTPPGWSSAEDFLEHGLGVVLLAGNEVASLCTSVFASQEAMEMDIHTAEEYRRQGLARLTASTFIEKCLRLGKQPNWECFWDNEASTMLAEKLGFHAEPDYPIYYWEE